MITPSVPKILEKVANSNYICMNWNNFDSSMIYTFRMNHKQESLNLIKILNTLTTFLLPRLDGRVFLADDVTASVSSFPRVAR